MTPKSEKQLKNAFNADSLILSSYNYQLTLNQPSIDRNNLSKEKITTWIIDYLKKTYPVES